MLVRGINQIFTWPIAILMTLCLASTVASATNPNLTFSQDYGVGSYGRTVIFAYQVSDRTFDPETETFVDVPMSGVSILFDLPAGVSFVSTDGTAPTVTGTPATGQHLAINLGASSTPFPAHSITVAITPTVADGASLSATATATGNDSSGAFTQVQTVSFQGGMLPVGIYVVEANSNCDGEVFNDDSTGNPFFNFQDQTGAGFAGHVEGEGGAFAEGYVDTLSVVMDPSLNPAKVGEITTQSSVVRLTGMGLRAAAAAGLIGLGGLARGIGANTDFCSLNVTVSFDNPNPFLVGIASDQRLSAYGSASDHDSTDLLTGTKFGYLGSVNDVLGFPGPFSVGEEGLHSVSVKTRILRANNGVAERHVSFNCFDRDPSYCLNNPPIDFVQDLSGSALQVPPFTTAGIHFGDFNTGVGFEICRCEGDANFAFDADTGDVSIVRTGYGNDNAAASLTFMRGDANVQGAESSYVGTVRVSGHSPITLLVTDSGGRRVGMAPPPSPSSPLLDSQPSSVSEIFGATYSGANTEPQVIEIPNPHAGDYKVQVTGTGAGPYSVTLESLDGAGNVLDMQSSSGIASPGSNSNANFNLRDDGFLTLQTPTCAANASSSVNITRGGLRYNFSTNRFVQTAVITNTGAVALQGPVSLVLDTLSTGATLFNAKGTTVCTAPLGSPYINLPLDSSNALASGAAVSVTLQFTDPTKAPITYSSRVLAGSGTQ